MPDPSPRRLAFQILGYGIAVLSGALLGAGAHAALVPRDASTSAWPMAPPTVEAPLCPPVPSCPPSAVPEPRCDGIVAFYATQSWEISGGPRRVTTDGLFPEERERAARRDAGVSPRLTPGGSWPCGDYSLLAKSRDDPKQTIPISIRIEKDQMSKVYLP